MSGILVTGAGGLVGGKIIRQLLESEVDSIHAIYHRPPVTTIDTAGRFHEHILDLASTTEIARLVATVEPRLVLHAAAMTNADACEQERTRAYTINTASTAAIAMACAAIGARLVYVSTDYVFDGSNEQPGPYTEDAPVHPLNYYGLTKLRGEEAVREYCTERTNWAICRTTVVYGYAPGVRPNFALWLLSELRAGHVVRVVTDQYSTPTLVDHLAVMLIAVGLRGGDGVYHTAGTDCLDRLSFARQLAEAFALDTSLLKPITTADLCQVAPRPLRSGLLCHRIRAELGIRPISIHEGIDILRSQLT